MPPAGTLSSGVPGRVAFLKYWLPVVAWMGLIFVGSTNLLAASETSRFLGPLLRWLVPSASAAEIVRMQTFIRKGGHVTEYAVLAILLWRARRQPVPGEARPWSRREAWLAIGLAAMYACTDEFHQSFVPSREGALRDVGFDTAGACAGIAIVWVTGRWRKRW